MTKILWPTGRLSASATLSVLLCPLCLALACSAAAAQASVFTLSAGIPQLVTPNGIAAALKTETPGQASPNGKTLTFRGSSVRLVAVTGPDTDMLSYRIDGKRNPTLVVTRGATLKMLFVNTDDDMKHNVRFGAALQAYPSVMTSYLKASVGTPELAHKSGPNYSGEELTLRMPAAPGTYAYLCTVRGHAQGGMVGKVIVQ